MQGLLLINSTMVESKNGAEVQIRKK